MLRALLKLALPGCCFLPGRVLMPTPLVLRAGQSQVGAHQNLLQRGGHAVVPAPRRPAGLHGVLHAHRHVVSHGCQPRVPRGSEPPAGCSHPTGGAAPHMPTALGVPKGGGLSSMPGCVLHPLGLLAVPVRADFPPQQPQPSLWGILGASLSLTPPLLLRFRGVGCIHYEMVTGRPMFPGSTVKEELHLIFRLLGEAAAVSQTPT